jgi:hypothetical protein
MVLPILSSASSTADLEPAARGPPRRRSSAKACAAPRHLPAPGDPVQGVVNSTVKSAAADALRLSAAMTSQVFNK